MKGIIFTVFNQMVEEKMGLEIWDELLQNVNPISKGIYTSAGTYNDQEFLDLIEALSKKLKTNSSELMFAFGEEMIRIVSKTYPTFFQNKNLIEFLKSVHGVIHVEVKKLYPDAVLPQFIYEEPGKNELIMLYKSERKFCRLAEGLIHGASQYYKTKVIFDHSICMKKGADHCRIGIKTEI